ncbi:uncharacterized protein LOC119733351 isoform X2 [Patiria miniata]|uniref:Netrin receptor UNC5 n=1 Tax=Patiria miniata TaxID=46514 RepID=A0A914AGN5_PATMI|nr:uncharacterized protein LOC119733351 isoform X2 [Patiria miniata]
MISNELGSEWRQLARHLGLSAAEIERIVMDDPGHTPNQIFNMLVKWRHQQSTSTDQRDVLDTALMEIGRWDIAEDLLDIRGGSDSFCKLCNPLSGTTSHYPLDISDFDLRMISNELGSEWRKLATNLGLSTAEIEHIVMDDPGQTDKQIFIMLVKWKSRVSTSLDQREVLCKALMEIGRRDIAEYLLDIRGGSGNFCKLCNSLSGTTSHYPLERGTTHQPYTSIITEIHKEKVKGGDAKQSTPEIGTAHQPYTTISTGSSPTKWLQGRSSVDAHDLHLYKWMPTGTIDRKNDRLWPFCIVATPNEIAVTARGQMVWIHYINGVLKTIIETEEDIQGISATQDRLVVVGASTHLVYMYTMNGQLDFKFSTVQHEEVKDAVKQVAIWPWSVASKKNGAIIVGDVVRYVLTEHRPKDGKILRTMQVKIKPEYLAVDDDDRILVSDRHTILVVDDSGSETFTQPTIDGRLAESYGLCCTKSAIYVIVSDDGGNTGRIHQYDKRGNFVESIALGLFRHMGITVTADQRYLAIASDYHVKIYKAKEHEVKSMSTETTSSKMPSRPTHKISEDTEDQRLQEPSHLQQVLDEVNKLAENLTASERLDSRLQLPYIAMGYFNEKGGSLSLDEYGVHLTIPRGAIAPGSPQQVYIYVDPTVVGPKEVAFSPNVDCGPEGLRFEESVVLSFPHHADVRSTSSDPLKPQMCQDNYLSDTWEEFDGNAVITEDRVILLVNHFTRFNLPGRRKRLVVVPYGDVFDPRQGKYQIRVYILNDDKKAKKNVEKDETHSKRLDGFKTLSWGEGDLAVKLSEFPRGCKVYEEETQTIHEKQIKEQARNCVTFTLGLPSWSADDVLYCAVETYQDNGDEYEREQGKVRLSICPDMKTPDRDAVQMPVCDQAAACSQTVSPQSAGATSGGSRMTIQDEVGGGFSKREPNHSAMAESCDSVGQTCSDTHWQVEKLLEARNDNGDNSTQRGTVNGDTFVFIFRSDVETTSTLCQKIIQEICRVKTEEEKLSRRKVVDDTTLLYLACELGSEWERLATFLGFGVNDVYKFKNDNPHDTNNQIFQMLVKWRDEQYLTELVDCLGRELTKVNKGEMAKTLRDIDDSSLHEVSNQLGSDWETFATALGCDTHKVKNEFPYDTREHCFQMLVEWRAKQLSPNFQVDKLCKELKRVDREELADTLRELISDRDSEKPGLLEKPQVMEQASGDHASAIGNSQPSVESNYSQEELVSDRNHEKAQLLKKPQVKKKADGDHASGIGSEPPSTKTKNSQKELIRERDSKKPQILENSLKALHILENTREGKAEPHSQQQLRVVNKRE